MRRWGLIAAASLAACGDVGAERVLSRSQAQSAVTCEDFAETLCEDACNCSVGRCVIFPHVERLVFWEREFSSRSACLAWAIPACNADMSQPAVAELSQQWGWGRCAANGTQCVEREHHPGNYGAFVSQGCEPGRMQQCLESNSASYCWASMSPARPEWQP